MRLSERIRDQQQRWLHSRGAAVDERGYARRIEDNVFAFSDAARRELSNGRGRELGRPDRPGKLAAPWSSSALAINFFEPWREGDKRVLADALGAPGAYTRLRLEHWMATGFGPSPANLDVSLADEAGALIAIESKFLEPFSGGVRGTLRDTISDTYLKERNRDLWFDLAHLRALAKAIRDGARDFRRLDAPQLIKHAIALTRAGQPFELLHLWYRPADASQEVVEMEQELDVFSAAAAADRIRFRSITYQQVFERLRASEGADRAHVAYLADRYFDAEP